jgi:hexosaminidase
MNILHLHLSDDQGWRIEIKSWPNLTKHGGSTQVGGGAGGFYTQEQYSDIIKYGQDRFVTIIPEIDMPGHTNAAFHRTRYLIVKTVLLLYIQRQKLDSVHYV